MEAQNQTEKPLSKEQFLAFRAAFKQRARNKDVSVYDIMIYHILCGRDAYYGFTPISRPSKLSGFCTNNPWYIHNTVRLYGLRIRMKFIIDPEPQPTDKYFSQYGYDTWLKRKSEWHTYFQQRFNYTIPETAWEYIYDKVSVSNWRKV